MSWKASPIDPLDESPLSPWDQCSLGTALGGLGGRGSCLYSGIGAAPLFVCGGGWDFKWGDGSCDGPGSNWVRVLFEFPHLQLFLCSPLCEQRRAFYHITFYFFLDAASAIIPSSYTLLSTCGSQSTAGKCLSPDAKEGKKGNPFMT